MVTNLNDSGKGSLREAVEAEGKRIVTFAIDGIIHLEKPLRINNDDITIAGQTAPGGGICIMDYPLSISASNVIVRYLRVRVGDKHKADADGLSGGRYGQKNVIIDHCSVSWSIDECLSIYKTENLTVQWCLVAHSLTKSLHTKGSHGFGGIWGGYKASFHHNLLANHSSRNPRFSSVDGTKWVDCRNNVIYNWGFKTAYGGGQHGEINLVNNYYKPGPASQHHRLLDVAEDGTGRYYVAGNVMEGDADVTQNNYHSAVNDRAGKKYIRIEKQIAKSRGISPEAIPTEGEETSTCLVAEPFPYTKIPDESAEESYDKVQKYVGCSFERDDYDKEIIRQMLAGTGEYGNNGLIDTPSEVKVSVLPKIAKRAEKDSDHDGMPDKWEKTHGLNPHDSSDASCFTLSSDYCNIEMYIESISK